MIGAFAALLLGLAAFLAVKRLVFLMDDADLDQEIAEVGECLALHPQLASDLLGVEIVSPSHFASWLPAAIVDFESVKPDRDPPFVDSVAALKKTAERLQAEFLMTKSAADFASGTMAREMVDEGAARQPCNLGEHTCLLWRGHDGPCRNYAPLGTPASTRWRDGEYEIVERTEILHSDAPTLEPRAAPYPGEIRSAIACDSSCDLTGTHVGPVLSITPLAGGYRVVAVRCNYCHAEIRVPLLPPPDMRVGVTFKLRESFVKKSTH